MPSLIIGIASGNGTGAWGGDAAVLEIAPLSWGGGPLARVAEWQTQGTQNPPGATPCEFDSRLGHHSPRYHPRARALFKDNPRIPYASGFPVGPTANQRQMRAATRRVVPHSQAHVLGSDRGREGKAGERAAR